MKTEMIKPVIMTVDGRGEDKLNPSRDTLHIMVTQTIKDRKFLLSSMELRFISHRYPLIYSLMRAF